MKVYELAKQLGISSKELLTLIATAGLPQAHASNNLDAAEVVLIQEIHRQSQKLDTPPTPEPEPTPETETLFTGRMVDPPRLHKYARTRGISLAEAIDACNVIGIENARMHMEVDRDRVSRLDEYFKTKVNP